MEPQLKKLNESNEFLNNATAKIMEGMKDQGITSIVSQVEAWRSKTLDLQNADMLKQFREASKVKDVYTSH
jgi:hypothetical protein|nr:MAG TPA: hypothetical protein [Caudoviricetes sp.]